MMSLSGTRELGSGHGCAGGLTGPFSWSQHAWTEEKFGYLGNAADIFPTSMHQGDLIAAYIRNEYPELVAHLLWRVKNHFDHVHFDTWPQGYGTPPCKGQQLHVRYPDGTFGRTFHQEPVPEPPPPIIDDDMYAPVAQGDEGVAVEAWQRIMQQITGFKPPVWGVFGVETTRELQKLVGPGDNIGPGEGAALFASLGKKD